MANTAHEPVQPAPPAAPDPEAHTGVYGFFRRHQKKLLYTVGIFTLLTFSVSGPMLAAVRSLFETERDMPTLVVGGERVKMTSEDFLYGNEIARHLPTLGAVVPPIDPGDGGQSDLGWIYSVLRRVAVAEGLDVSLAEVDRAIETMRARADVASPQQLATLHGYSSLAQYRLLLAEAMRIGTLVRLHTLVLDNSDERILKRVIADKEKITFKVATFDEKALGEELKKAGGVTDDDLKKWLDGKPDADKHRLQVFDTNRVELRFGALTFAEFDAAQWQDEALKDFTIGDDQLKKLYDTEKEQRWKKPDGSYQTLDEVKPEATKLLQTERVLMHVLGKLRERQNEWIKPEIDEVNRCSQAHSQQLQVVEEAKAKLAATPNDEALKNEVRLASEAVEPLRAAMKAAEEALAAKRATFDFVKEFTALTNGADGKPKAGVVQKQYSGKKNAKELKDLDALGTELGQWPLAVYATYLANKGDLANLPGRSNKAAFLYQLTDVDVRPLKPWDELKPLLEDAYFTEQAKTQAEAKKKVMEEELLALAKAKMPDKVQEIEGRRTAAVDEKLAKWEKETQTELAKAEEKVADKTLAPIPLRAWTQRRDDLQAQLAKKDEKKKAFDEEVGKQIELDIAAEAKKFHAEVLEAAAAKAGFAVSQVGPYPRELSSKPRFDKDHDPTVVFLFRSHSAMKVGESTGVVQDVTNRRWHVACCVDAKPLTYADVDRRDFALLRRGYGMLKSFASLQALEAYGQAFSRKALEQRYSYQDPAGEAPAKGSTGGEPKKDEGPKKPDEPQAPQKPDEPKKEDEKGK